ncbi:hypothetical protein HFP89_02425 [Wenzhouxiangella sp. XN79A]|uniref:hypothetical protein n=1 Tax=Wenzhouxiangella sp. XN79A TaxID=2724193 RepID=UPI00144AD018|nr:hypothetical protein [Wenzhouxiangella sp. XN79A]NKI34021.1 hypothetical protein [Wenzhouxiangella sp. XN79A]
MPLSILVDLLISAPVVAFLIWLYARSAPSGRSAGMRALDRTLMVLTPLALVAIIVGIHATMDLDGMGRNVIAVATAYLAVLALLGSGWVVRFLRAR